MKILMIAVASRSVIWFRQELIKYFLDNGHTIDVVVCDNEYKEQIESLGVNCHIVKGDNRDTGFISNLKYVFQLKKLVKEINPDKIMTFQAKANAFGVIACKLAGYKDIHAMVEGLGTAYNSHGIKGKILLMVSNILNRIAFKNIKTVIFLNDDNRLTMQKYKLVKENQILQIEGIGLDLEKYKFKPLDKVDDPVKFVMVARQVYDKGIKEYCECAKRILEGNKYSVEFHYIGDEDEASDLLKNYVENGYVIYDGCKKDVSAILENYHVMVLPSYHEGAPRTLMEASAVGRTMVVSDIAGCRVICQDNKTGLLCNLKDVDDLVRKCEVLIENKETIIQFGKNARKYAEENFDCNKINKVIYDKVFN